MKKTWKSKLTKKQIDHIKDTTDNCLLREFKENRRFHTKLKAKEGEEPCWNCREIAIRLGLEK